MTGFWGPIGLPELLAIFAVLVGYLALLAGLVVLIRHIVRRELDRRGIRDPSDQPERPPE